jgi:hypothetical protein
LNTRSINNNQHFVQKSYLKRFSHGEGFIRLFIKDRSKYVERTSISDQCSKSSHHGSDGELAYVESWLRIIEGAADKFNKNPVAMLLAHNAANKDFQENSDWEKFLCHIVTQMARTPVLAHERSPFIELMRQMGSTGSAFGFHTTTWNLINALTRYSFIADLTPVLLEAPAGSYFLTSDFPAAATNFAGDLGLVKNNAWSLNSAGIAICYPINERFILLLVDQFVYDLSNIGGSNIVTEKDVEKLNILQILNCDKVFFTMSANEMYLRELFEKSRRMRPREHWVETSSNKKIHIERRHHAGIGSLLSILQLRKDPKFYRDTGSEHDLRYRSFTCAAMHWEAAVQKGQSEIFQFLNFYASGKPWIDETSDFENRVFPFIFPPYSFATESVKGLFP